MKKFDPENFTSRKLLGVTSENFVPIYLPLFLSIALFALGIVLVSLTNNSQLFRVIFGLCGLIFALSGLGQIKLKEVPGFPTIRGGCAVIFGLFYFLLFLSLGIVVIFFE